MSVPVIVFDLGNTLVHGPSDNRQPFDDTVATIAELWQRGYRIALLSDQLPGTTEAQVRTKMDGYGLESYRFDLVTISSEFDPPVYKPAPQIFQTALAKAGFAAASNDTVFVTESLDHILAARNLGWRAIHMPFDAPCGAASGECIETLGELLALFPPLAVDLFVRDASDDPGDDAYGGNVFWNSPDMWVRNGPDGGSTHENPEAGQDNVFHTRVHNRGVGIARVFSVTWAVSEWAGTQFVYPDDYWPFVTQALGSNLAPGDTASLQATWPAADVPPAGTHACWLTMIHYGGQDGPAVGAHVWEHNNLAQKNLTIVDLQPGEGGELPFVIGNRAIDHARRYRLELHRSAEAAAMTVAIQGQTSKVLESLASNAFVVPKTVQVTTVAPATTLRFIDRTRVELIAGAEALAVDLEPGSVLTVGGQGARTSPPRTKRRCAELPVATLRRTDGAAPVAQFPKGRASALPIGLAAHQIAHARLQFTVPEDACPGTEMTLDLVQRDVEGQAVGGISVLVRVAKPRRARRKKKRG